MYIFFDTETTGFPRNWKAPVTDVDNWPRMVQIAWMVYDEMGNKQETKDYIIQPEGYTIPKRAADVHGISTARAKAEGQDLTMVLEDFSNALAGVEVVVAHNIAFDEKIIGAEFTLDGFPPPLCPSLSLHAERVSWMYQSGNNHEN